MTVASPPFSLQLDVASWLVLKSYWFWSHGVSALALLQVSMFPQLAIVCFMLCSYSKNKTNKTSIW